jgi:hypothetical protein
MALTKVRHRDSLSGKSSQSNEISSVCFCPLVRSTLHAVKHQVVNDLGIRLLNYSNGLGELKKAAANPGFVSKLREALGAVPPAHRHKRYA